MRTLNFCTLFDHNYLPRGLILYNSLMKHCPNAVLHVLCLTDECQSILQKMSLPNIELTNISKLESYDNELLTLKESRSWAEYLFTLSPCWPLYLLKHNKHIDILTMVDADAAFFSSPYNLLKIMDTTSVAISAHHFPERLRRLEKFGLYNVGFQSFKNDDIGNSCLSWWRKKCLEWCTDSVEEDRYADQKYLNQWSSLFGAKVFEHSGVNIGPWNVDSFNFTLRDGRVYSNTDLLVFVHFQNVSLFMNEWWDVGFIKTHSSMTLILHDFVYKPYLKSLIKETNNLDKHSGIFSAQKSRLPLWKRLLSNFYKFIVFSVARKQLIFIPKQNK